MTRIPVYVSGEIAIKDLEDALHSIGFHLRIDVGGRFVIDRIPKFLRRDTQHEADVVRMPARMRRVKP